MKMIEKSDRAL